MTEQDVFPGPFSYLSLLDRQSLSFVPARWEYGSYTFTRADGRQKTVVGVRVWFSEKVGMRSFLGLPYIDIGQQKLLFQLRALLAGTVPDLMEYTVTAYGSAPTTTYSVSVRQIS